MAGEGYFGWQGLPDATGEANVTAFAVRQALNQVRTFVPVEVVKIKRDGGTGRAATVDLRITVNQTNGVGDKQEHTTIYNVPCARLQGGKNGIVNDPVVGDKGVMVVMDRDISALKSNNGAVSNPGSKRTFDLSDGVYMGAFLNPESLEQYVAFTANGVIVADKNGNKVEMDSGGIRVTGNGATIEIVSAGLLKLGGNGGGSYAFVETVAGTSSSVMASL